MISDFVCMPAKATIRITNSQDKTDRRFKLNVAVDALLWDFQKNVILSVNFGQIALKLRR